MKLERPSKTRSHRRAWQLGTVTLLLLTVLAPWSVQAQPGTAFSADFDISALRRDVYEQAPGIPEFTWIRGRYQNYSGGRSWRGGWWDTDYPEAEQNFMRGVQRYTHIDAHTDNVRALELTDPELFEHIFLYISMKRVPIGSTRSGPNFQPEEIESLREFMFRGGFVMLDDFWGDAHWRDFLLEINKVFPDRELVELSTDHDIFHIFYDVDEIVQVPGRAVTWNNYSFTLDDPSYPPSVHAILDDDGRVMLVANFNTDMGDGWEHTFDERFPTHYTNEAYKLGINYLIYAYTH